MRTWKQKHLAFLDLYVTEGTIVHDTKEHITSVLIEPFLFNHESGLGYARTVVARLSTSVSLTW